jgi:hypothetical protein
MLALQEEMTDAPPDERGRQQAQDVLSLLAELQRAMLQSGGDTRGLVERLDALTITAPLGLTPAMSLMLRAVILRARVELARFR